jgi:pimeloyl-ACP methyl ester carboxylesterase
MGLLATSAFGQAALYEYDRTTPFEYHEEVNRRDARVEVAGAGFRSPKGGKVNMIVVRPRGTGPYAGIIYQHGGGQTMMTYIAEAEVMARAGAVVLILDAPGSGPGAPTPPADKGAAMRENYVHLTVCYRRAIDYLESLKTVDPKRIAFVGHSYGGISGSAMVAVDRRVRAFVLIGAVARYTRHVGETKIDYWDEWRKGMSPEQLAAALAQFRAVDPDNFVGAAGHGPILLQCGNFDFINVDACVDLEKATSAPKEVRWYDTDHGFVDIEAMMDRMRWLGEALGMKGVKAEVDRVWNAPAKRTTPERVK